jgi:hypothetical protein
MNESTLPTSINLPSSICHDQQQKIQKIEHYLKNQPSNPIEVAQHNQLKKQLLLLQKQHQSYKCNQQLLTKIPHTTTFKQSIAQDKININVMVPKIHKSLNLKTDLIHYKIRFQPATPPLNKIQTIFFISTMVQKQPDPAIVITTHIPMQIPYNPFQSPAIQTHLEIHILYTTHFFTTPYLVEALYSKSDDLVHLPHSHESYRKIAQTIISATTYSAPIGPLTFADTIQQAFRDFIAPYSTAFDQIKPDLIVYESEENNDSPIPASTIHICTADSTTTLTKPTKLKAIKPKLIKK